MAPFLHNTLETVHLLKRALPRDARTVLVTQPSWACARNQGYHSAGPNKDYRIWGSILGARYLGKLPSDNP